MVPLYRAPGSCAICGSLAIVTSEYCADHAGLMPTDPRK